MRLPERTRPHLQRGAALLLAMLTVTLVATLAAAAAWQQWRAIEIEMADRQRSQASWILTGALDWSRLILREDARGNRNSGNADHLAEPWSMPLEEARLSTFLAADKDNNADDVMEAFLSGYITDQQARLNVRNLLAAEGDSKTTTLSAPDVAAFRQLFLALGLPEQELERLTQGLLAASSEPQEDAQAPPAPLRPQRYAQLAWLGISPSSLKALEPHATWLPVRTRVNLNTASAEVIAASMSGVEPGLARQLVALREITPFSSLDDVRRALPEGMEEAVDSERHDVRSQYFEIHGRLRLDDTVIEERTLVARSGLLVGVRWRQRRSSVDTSSAPGGN